VVVGMSFVLLLVALQGPDELAEVIVVVDELSDNTFALIYKCYFGVLNRSCRG